LGTPFLSSQDSAVNASILLALTFPLITKQTSLYSGPGHPAQAGLGRQVVSLFYPASPYSFLSFLLTSTESAI